MSEPYIPYEAPPPPSAAGLTDNVAGGLAYLTVIPAIIFLILAPYNRRPFIRFHCFQSIFLTVASIASNLLHILPFFGTILSLIIGLVLFVLWLIAIIQAFQGKRFMIPGIGPLAVQAAAG